MTIFLYTLFIKPIGFLIELLFSFFYKPFDNYGFSIVAISVFVGLLTLPLYHAAEELQRKEREKRQSLQSGIDRIKASFKGDEQYLILSAFYRQNGYHPLYALRNSLNLLIQVPFFVAAYHFLSNLPQLQGDQFFFIRDLGQPDALLAIGSLSINVLPILMTLINVITGAIYTKGFAVRDKIQLYGIAGLFLVLLYSSPAALVFYWTLNNLFSLAKTLFYKLKHPLWILYGLAAGFSLVLAVLIIRIKPNLPRSKHLILIFAALGICAIPLIVKGIKLIQEHFLSGLTTRQSETNRLFFISITLLWVLYGILLPSNLIHSSSIEFSFVGNIDSPLFFLGHTTLFFLGFWLLWPSLFYWMTPEKDRPLFAFGLFMFSISSLVNTFLFRGSYSHLNQLLMFDNPALLIPNVFLTILPIVVMLFIFLVGLLLIKHNRVKVATMTLTILLIGSTVSGGYSTISIAKEFADHKKHVSANLVGDEIEKTISPMISLSRNQPNVVILFLDRAINSFFPLIIENLPQLVPQYKGFIYYPNTVSFGAYTLGGAPAVMAGYEYTPDAINERKNEKLVDKHNEATLVLPRLFSEAGFSTTVFDPPFANYQWSDDFSAFAPYPEIKVYRMLGRYSLLYKNEHKDELDWDPNLEGEIIFSKLPMYSFFKSAFPILRSMIYDQGTYFLMGKNPQLTDAFLDSYAILHYLPEITSLDNDRGSYVFLTNDTTHEPMFLQSPEYIPLSEVTDVSNPLQTDLAYNEIDQIHYHANAAALLRIGEWLQYLQEEEIYDNTRIIIVADHGRDILTPVFKDFNANQKTLGYYNPLLLVKDFNASEPLEESLQFMTNGDVPLFAIKDLEVSPINPFTGNNLFDATKKDEVNSYFSSADPKDNKSNTFVFDYSQSFTVKDSIFLEENWNPLSKE